MLKIFAAVLASASVFSNAEQTPCCICDLSGNWNRLLGSNREGFSVRETVQLTKNDEPETIEDYIATMKVENLARRLRGASITEPATVGTEDRKPKDAPFESERLSLSESFVGQSELYPRIEITSYRNRSVTLKTENRQGRTSTVHGRLTRGCVHIDWANRAEAWCQRPHCTPRLNLPPASPVKTVVSSPVREKVCDISGEWTGLVGGTGKKYLPSLTIDVHQQEDMFFADASGLWDKAKGVLSADGLMTISIPLGGKEHGYQGLIDNDCKRIRWIGLGSDNDESKSIIWCKRGFCAPAINNYLPMRSNRLSPDSRQRASSEALVASM